MNSKLLESKPFIVFSVLIILAAAIYFAIDFIYWTEKSLAPSGPTETTGEYEGVINIKEGEAFVLDLEANPTTGYQWQVGFQRDYVKLLSREYLSEGEEGLVGAGGREVFTFSALIAGETEITFFYLRPWEEDVEPIKTLIYKVDIVE